MSKSTRMDKSSRPADRTRGGWRFAIDLSSRTEGALAGEPLFQQIARALADDIARGRLVPGQALPGTRTLAATLGVHRNTVLAAYLELLAEGWLETVAARVTAVSRSLPLKPARAFAPRQV